MPHLPDLPPASQPLPLTCRRSPASSSAEHGRARLRHIAAPRLPLPLEWGHFPEGGRRWCHLPDREWGPLSSGWGKYPTTAGLEALAAELRAARASGSAAEVMRGLCSGRA